MTDTELVDRLVRHKTLGAAPREELAWLAAHGSIRRLETGGILTPQGQQVDGLFVVLSGCIAIFIDRGAGPNKVMEWRGGDVTGLLPYSRLVTPPADTVAQEPTVVLAVPRDQIRSLIRECYELTAILVHGMLDRARVFASSDFHDEKMISLGKLSAGLAHELNNPAAAIERGAALLEDGLEEYERTSRALGAAGLTEPQRAAVEAVRDACMAVPVRGVRSPLEQSEREDAIADWLVDHGLGSDIADPLGETVVTLEMLDRLAQQIAGPVLNIVLRWIASGSSVRGLASDIQGAAMHISGLVTAVKGFTHMDRAITAEPVDLLQGLNNAVAVLRAKARAKSIALTVDVEPGLPPVQGFTGELNQIWANLIDNALDAVPESGTVNVTARREQNRIAVRVIDDGPGIAKEIRDKVFDPFFTTKPVGLGTGLGLDIVRRLVRHNDAEIAVESQPGRTEFRVLLPLAEVTAAGNRHE